MLADQRVELGRHLRVAPAREVGLEPVAEAGEAQVLEPRDLGLREALAADVGERGAAPQRERVAQRRRRRARIAARELVAPAPRARREAVGVERAGRDAQRVAAALVHDEPSPSAARSREASTCTAPRACCGPHPAPRARRRRGRRGPRRRGG